jgi:hypothetical protein
VADRELGFSDVRDGKKIFNYRFAICEGKRRLCFPNWKSSFAVADRELDFSDVRGGKKIFNYRVPIYEGKRRLCCPNLKSSFVVADRGIGFFRSATAKEDLQLQTPIREGKRTFFSRACVNFWRCNCRFSAQGFWEPGVTEPTSTGRMRDAGKGETRAKTSGYIPFLGFG